MGLQRSTNLGARAYPRVEKGTKTEYSKERGQIGWQNEGAQSRIEPGLDGKY